MADDDPEDVYICHACIGDAYLKGEVRRDGRRRKCDFCEKTRKAWPLEELAARVRGVIEEHFRITPSDPSEEGWIYDGDMSWERRGEPVGYVIAEIARLEPEPAEAVRDRLSEETFRNAFESGEEDPFGSDTHYEEGQPDIYDFRESWDFFRGEIRTRSRFFSRSAQEALDGIFGDLAGMRNWEGKPAVKEMLPTDADGRLFRARIAYSEFELREILADPVKKIGPPPSRLARAGRMNAAGISVFYGAMEADTCIAEARAPVGSFVVLGPFELTRTVRILDLDVLTRVVTDESWFDPGFTVRSNRAAFLRHLVQEIGRPIMPRDEEFEYLPTQAVSEYLASCVEPKLDGILFHSAQTAGEGRNIVLFNHAAGVEPYALPEGTKTEVQMGWASEDDEDDSITVWEEVTSPKAVDGDKPARAVASFADVLALASPSDSPEKTDDQFLGYVTLRLDVDKIEVFRIRAVKYDKIHCRVSRHRHSTDEELPF